MPCPSRILILCACLLRAPAALAAAELVVDFEEGKVPAGLVQKIPRPANLQIQSEIVRAGNFAARFELKQGDLFHSRGKPDGYRVELKDPFRARMGEAYWYAFSLYLPKNFPRHQNRLVLGQWNAEPDPGEELLDRSPPLSQRYTNGEFLVQLFNGAEKAVLFRGPLPLGAWVDLLYHVRWSPRGDGLVEAWMDGRRIVSYQGRTSYEDKLGPYFKFGIYRNDRPETYTAYFDEYRRGRSRQDVALPPAPPPGR